MERGAQVMRKSTRPAGGTSKPCSHIPDTRYYKGVGAQWQLWEPSSWDHIGEEDNPADDDPR